MVMEILLYKVVEGDSSTRHFDKITNEILGGKVLDHVGGTSYLSFLVERDVLFSPVSIIGIVDVSRYAKQNVGTMAGRSCPNT